MHTFLIFYRSRGVECLLACKFSVRSEAEACLSEVQGFEEVESAWIVEAK